MLVQAPTVSYGCEAFDRPGPNLRELTGKPG